MARIEVVESKVIVKELILDDKDAALLLLLVSPGQRFSSALRAEAGLARPPPSKASSP